MIKTFCKKNHIMEVEIWKDVIGYEGLYEVSNLGRLKSLDRLVPHLRKGFANRKGKILSISKKSRYPRTSICRDFGTKNVSVHRLVAEAFLPNPDNKPCVNHIDNNPQNNRVENLEWVTSSENRQHALKQNRLKMDGRAVLNTSTGETYISISAAAKIHGIHTSTLHQRLNKNTDPFLKYL